MKFKPRRQQSFVGVDVGNGSVKIAAAHLVNEAACVTSAQIVPLPEGSVVDGQILNIDAVEQTIAPLIRRERLSGSHAYFSVPGNHSTFRWLSLPVLSEEELLSAATYKMQKATSTSAESVYYSVEASSSVPDASILDALVVQVDREAISSRAQLLRRCGLLPTGAETEAQSLLRVLRIQESATDPTLKDASVTLVDLGSTHSNMYVIQNGRLQFVRTVKFGMKKFEDKIVTDLGIPRPEAGRLVSDTLTEITEGGLLRMEIDGTTTILSVHAELQVLVREFTRLIRYFRSLHPERSYAGILDSMILCGGLAGLHGFPGYFRKILGLRVETLQAFEGLQGDLDNESFQRISCCGPCFGVSMGLAIKGLVSDVKEVANVDDSFAWIRTA